jgi:CHAT domain-containing protein/Tfp pilus assembly protein PilF
MMTGDNRMTLFRVSMIVVLALQSAGSAVVFEAQSALPAGIVVEQVTKDGSAAKAGIEPGDVVLSWSRPSAPPANPDPAQGTIGSPFELDRLETEQSPRGSVTLSGTRNGAPFSVTLPPGDWLFRTRPALTAESKDRYDEARRLVDSKEIDKGLNLWRELAANETNAMLRCWLLLRVANVSADNKKWADAHDAFELAKNQAKAAGYPIALAVIVEASARVFQRQNELDKAAEAFRDVLTIREQDAPGSLSVAWTLHDLGVLAHTRNDSTTADGFYRRAAAIREKLGPGSLDLSRTLNNLGILARNREDRASAEDFYRRALEIMEKLFPGSLDVARTLNNRGLVAKDRGDLVTAEDMYRRALAIGEKLAPDSVSPTSASLNNLGSVLADRGDLAAAEDFYRKSLAIKEKVATETLDVARTLNNLGIVQFRGKEYAAAEVSYRRALEITQKLAPGTVDVARIFSNLGSLAKERGDPATAEGFYRQALALGEKIAPGSISPVANVMTNLGDLARDRADLAAAQDFYQRSLAITEKAAPGSIALSSTLHRLGLISRRAGDSTKAMDYLNRALNELESQQAKLGGTDEVRSGFAAQYVDYYGDIAEQFVQIGRFDAAFHVLERSRARGLLEMLAERELVFRADIPAELEQERRLTDAEYDRTQARIAQLSPAKDGAEIERLLGRLREVRGNQQEIRERIRKASPRLAALQYPQPMTLESVQKNLDPGTVLLSYMVTSEKVFLFVVTATAQSRQALAVFPLQISEQDLRRKIEAFRSGIQHPEESRAAWVRQGRELYDLLVKPAASWVASGERVLISPDGPLHALPFAALVTDSRSDGSSPRYWIESKALHLVTSVTLYAELKRDRRRAPVSLVAFGDPSYPVLSPSKSETITDSQTRSLLLRGYSFEPLPASRSEVETIAGLYRGQATVYVGKEATEERVKATGKNVRYLHFAAHGILDERFPLNSALALSVPERPVEGQDNGLLQAWEIFERVRIDADLVVLSACESALGKEMGGEGLLGLTRAFQYAGARSIVASVWSVADESTAELMKRFYGYLKAGKTKDQALRAAQIDLIRTQGSRTNMAHPFHWAAFGLIGDWQ